LHSESARKVIEAMFMITKTINGAGAGILWTAQGKFLTLCGTDNNRGLINAYFWMIFMGSQVISGFHPDYTLISID
jgi:hypothetical protein